MRKFLLIYDSVVETKHDFPCLLKFNSFLICWMWRENTSWTDENLAGKTFFFNFKTQSFISTKLKGETSTLRLWIIWVNCGCLHLDQLWHCGYQGVASVLLRYPQNIDHTILWTFWSISSHVSKPNLIFFLLSPV